jgi:hypothetical protein
MERILKIISDLHKWDLFDIYGSRDLGPKTLQNALVQNFPFI